MDDRVRDELDKTYQFYHKIKEIEVEISGMKMSVSKLANDWICYNISYNSIDFIVLRSYQKDHWVMYTLSEPNICISRNYRLNPTYPDLLPTDWMSGKVHLICNVLIEKFNQEARLKLIH